MTDSDLDSIRNSCDVFTKSSKTAVKMGLYETPKGGESLPFYKTFFLLMKASLEIHKRTKTIKVSFSVGTLSYSLITLRSAFMMS